MPAYNPSGHTGQQADDSRTNPHTIDDLFPGDPEACCCCCLFLPAYAAFIAPVCNMYSDTQGFSFQQSMPFINKLSLAVTTTGLAVGFLLGASLGVSFVASQGFVLPALIGTVFVTALSTGAFGTCGAIIAGLGKCVAGCLNEMSENNNNHGLSLFSQSQQHVEHDRNRSNHQYHPYS